MQVTHFLILLNVRVYAYTCPSFFYLHALLCSKFSWDKNPPALPRYDERDTAYPPSYIQGRLQEAIASERVGQAIHADGETGCYVHVVNWRAWLTDLYCKSSLAQGLKWCWRRWWKMGCLEVIQGIYRTFYPGVKVRSEYHTCWIMSSNAIINHRWNRHSYGYERRYRRLVVRNRTRLSSY
jgi:hypothetical protein